MEILFDSISVLEAIYDLQLSTNLVAEENVIVSHYYSKSGDVDVLTEGVQDIMSLITSSIKSFIAKVRELIDKAIMVINSYRMEYSKLISKYGDYLRTADIKPFEIEGFQFTTLNVAKPDISEVYKIVDDFNNDIVKWSSITSSTIRQMRIDILSEPKMERLRGTVLGTNDRIMAEDFKRVAYCYYRNGQEFIGKLQVDKGCVDAILNGSDDLIKEKDRVTSEKKEVTDILNRMERFFSVKLSNLYDDLDKTYKVPTLMKSGYAADNAEAIREQHFANLSSYMSMRYQQVVELANIISLVFTERIAAVKDQINQETQILRAAIRQSAPVSESLTFSALEVANSYPPTPNVNWAPILEGVTLNKGEL